MLEWRTDADSDTSPLEVLRNPHERNAVALICASAPTDAKWLGYQRHIVELHIPPTDANLALLPRFPRLRVLKLLGHLQELPNAILELPLLEGLILRRVGLQRLPADLDRLTSLRLLVASYNRLHTLPESIASLTRLEELWLSNNNFKRFPEHLLKCPRLHILDMMLNPQMEMPREVEKQIGTKIHNEGRDWIFDRVI
jgi:hypothetical protein